MKMYEICFWVPGKFFKAIQYIRLAKPWPVERWFLHPIHTRWCPSERFIAFSWGPHNSNFTMVYGRYLYLLWFINQLQIYRTTIPMVFLNQRSHHWGGNQPCYVKNDQRLLLSFRWSQLGNIFLLTSNEYLINDYPMIIQ